MRDFVWIIFSVYGCFPWCFYFFEKAERRSLYSYPFSKLRLYDTPTNRFLLMMLDKYKHIAPRKKNNGYAPAKKERYYFYYTKKIYIFLMLLAVPWLVVIYIMDWYVIEAFVKWHVISSMIIGFLPAVILEVMMVMCDIKLQVYKRRNSEGC